MPIPCLMRRAVVLPSFDASVPKSSAGSIGIAGGLHICAPLVAEAGGGDGVAMFRPNRACKALNLRREVARLGDMDVQFSVG